MKLLNIKIVIVLWLLLSIGQVSYATKVFIQSPKTASSNRAPLSLTIMIDTEGKTVSGISGDFSFPSNLFDLESITTDGSIISLWGESPKISLQHHLDGRVHIPFEGIIPGGFSGIRSAYTSTEMHAKLFTVTLIPKSKGQDVFMVNDVAIHAYDEHATILSTKGDSIAIYVPTLTGQPFGRNLNTEKVESGTLSVTVNQSDLINNGVTYVYVSDSDPSLLIDYIYIAESSTYDPARVSGEEWVKVKNPHILKNQDRDTFVHVKVFYTNSTYAIVTLPPVENLSRTTELSRILMIILAVVLLLLYYGKNYPLLFRKVRRH